MITDEFTERLRRLRETESGSAVSWEIPAAKAPEAGVAALSAFSWCFFLEARIELLVSNLPSSVPWLGDVLGFGPKADSNEAVEVVVCGQGGYELSSTQPADESKGIEAFGGSASVMRDATGARGQWATGRYWCWPLPPSGPVEVALVWRAGNLNSVVATFSGDTMGEASLGSLPLDADFRHIGRI
jgi:hypothetical protein